MQAIRTIIWVLITIVVVGFVAINWTAVPINFWPLSGGKYLGLTWPVGIVALMGFLLGLLPMWLLHKTAAWLLRRRIGTLENSVRAASVSTPLAPPSSAQNDPPSSLSATTSEPPVRTL